MCVNAEISFHEVIDILGIVAQSEQSSFIFDEIALQPLKINAPDKTRKPVVVDHDDDG